MREDILRFVGNEIYVCGVLFSSGLTGKKYVAAHRQAEEFMYQIDKYIDRELQRRMNGIREAVEDSLRDGPYPE